MHKMSLKDSIYDNIKYERYLKGKDNNNVS